MDDQGRRQRIATFFARHFSVLEPGEQIEIRAFRDGKPLRSFHTTPDEAAAAVVALPADHDIYFGVNPRHDNLGTKAGVARSSCLWADVDDKHFGGDRELALRAIFDLGTSPTVIVRTGHGWQAYWSLCDSLRPAEFGRLEKVLRRLYLALGGVDSLQDVTRIFRVPYTVNNKALPVPVTLEVERGPVHELTAIEQALPAAPPSVRDQPSEADIREALGPTGTPSPEFVAQVLSYIDPCLPYPEHTLIWSGVARYYPGPEGLAMVDAWSTVPREAAGQYSTARSQPEKHYSFHRREGRVATMGTLIYYARKGGFVWPPPRPALPNPTTGKHKAREWIEPAPIPKGDLPELIREMYELVEPLGDGVGWDMVLQMVVTSWSTLWRKVKISGKRPNLWALGVAPSGTGKSRLTDTLWQITQMIQEPPQVITDGTPEGILGKLAGEAQALVLAVDEFADFVAKFNKNYMTGMAGELCRLHDGRVSTRILKSGSLTITDPFLHLIATTTPPKLRRYLSASEEMDGGLLNRFWITAPSTRRSLETITFQLDMKRAQALATKIDAQLLSLTNIREARLYTQVPPALLRVASLLGFNNQGRRTYREEVDDASPIGNRNLFRFSIFALLFELALPRPCVENGVLIVSEESCELAARLTTSAISYGGMVYGDLQAGEVERETGRLLRWLDKHPEGGTKRDLCMMCHLSAKGVSSALDMLIADNLVEEGIGTGGKTVYRIPGRAVPLDADEHPEADSR